MEIWPIFGISLTRTCAALWAAALGSSGQNTFRGGPNWPSWENAYISWPTEGPNWPSWESAHISWPTEGPNWSFRCLDCGHIRVPNGYVWFFSSRPHMLDLVVNLFLLWGPPHMVWANPKRAQMGKNRSVDPSDHFGSSWASLEHWKACQFWPFLVKSGPFLVLPQPWTVDPKVKKRSSTKSPGLLENHQMYPFGT